MKKPTKKSRSNVMEEKNLADTIEELDAHEIAYYAVRGTDGDPIVDVERVREMIERFGKQKWDKGCELQREECYRGWSKAPTELDEVSAIKNARTPEYR